MACINYVKMNYKLSCLLSVAPVCRPGQRKIVGAPRKESITVACEVEANPPRVEIFWKFSNTNGSVDIPSAQFTVDSTRSLLEYTALFESDYGILTCWAKNDQGTQAQPCVYHVIPAGKSFILY